MTTRTYTNYHCTSCAATGFTLYSENDAPFSANWESFKVEGMRAVTDVPERYDCNACGAAMAIDTDRPHRRPY